MLLLINGEVILKVIGVVKLGYVSFFVYVKIE